MEFFHIRHLGATIIQKRIYKSLIMQLGPDRGLSSGGQES
jgi:hypothetical protein